MARPSNTVPKYRKHSSGQARVTINGRDYLLGPHGSKASVREYDRLVAEYLSSGRSPAFGIDADAVTVAMVLASYLKHCRSYYGTKATSEYHRIKLVVRAVKSLYASQAADEFGPTQLKAVRQTFIDAGNSRGYINGNIKRLVRVFKWAAGEELIPASVYQTLRLVPGLRRGKTKAKETEAVKPVPIGDVEATIKHLLPTPQAMVRIQLLTGCRPGEVCKLTPRMIDRSGDVWEADLAVHKTAHHGRQRIIYFGPQAQAVLKPFLLRGENDGLFSPADTAKQRRERDHAKRRVPLSHGNRPGKSNRSLTKGKTRKPGNRYETPAYGRAIARAAALANVPHWSPNQLRHTKGTEVRKLFGLDAAASVLGHSNVTITQVYAEQDRERAIEVARQIG